MELHLNDDQIEELLLQDWANREESIFDRQGRDDVKNHLQTCERCQARVRDQRKTIEQLALLRRIAPEAAGPECPPDGVWLEISTGSATEDSESYLRHAVHCDHCGPLLRQAGLDLATELTPEETSAISDLRSATPEWQKTLAATLRKANSRNADVRAQEDRYRSWPGALLSPRRLVLAVLVIGSVSIALWLSLRRSPIEREEQLLAQAYTEQRTIPFRMPGAHYGHLRVTRGEKASHMERPLSLLQAETQLASQQQHGNQDHRWLLAAAYADLLEGDYERAVQILEPDRNANIPEIDVAIATAYYQRGKQSHTPDDLGKAREAIGRALDKEPRNPIALFNLALIDEGMELYNQAINDWQQYLLVDGNGEWSREAREHLARCQQIKDDKEKSTDGQSLLTPEAISVMGTSKVLNSTIDRRIEDYQLRVFTSYFPTLTNEDPPSGVEHSSINQQAIRRLGQISEIEHHDRMLVDLIASGGFSRARIPAMELASAIAANQTGDEQEALSRAKRAYLGFRQIGNRAGSLRSQFEIVYAMQFMSRSADCVILAHRLATDARHAGYSWLTAEAEIEAGFCADMNGDLSGSGEDLRFAARDANDAHYDTALDRALVGEAGMQWQAGSTTTAWNLALAGLKHFWESSIPYDRGESFCDFLDEMAEQKHQWHLQSAFLMESLSLLERGQDRIAAAQVMVRLAGSQLTLHRVEVAKPILAKALTIFSTAPQTPSTQGQELMVRINLAKAEAASHDYLTSASQLEKLRPQLAQLHENLSLIEFYTTLGEAYRKLGEETKAGESDLAAIDIFRNGLSKLSRARDRLTWHRQVSSAYRSLVQLRIDQHKPAEALRIWQDYRLAGLPMRQIPTSKTASEARLGKPEEFGTTIVYANLPDGPFAWALSGERMNAIRLPSSYDEVSQLGDRFTEECSSQSSDIANLLANGRQLYRILIAPFANFLLEDGTVLIEPDDELARVPFSALVDFQGRFLNATNTIAISPFSEMPARLVSARRPPDRRDLALLIESRSALEGSRGEDSQSDNEIKAVASFFPNHTTIRSEVGAKRRFLRLLKDAAIFHYAGHSATSSNGSAFVLQERNLAGAEYSISLRSDDLEGIRLRYGKLAVLSACETDRGQGGQWLDRDNIAVTLLVAGIPEVVASRWNIDSGATTNLMQEFYADVSKGISVPKSLRYAAEKTRQLHEYQHPYFWASFSVLERSGSN